MVVKMEQKELNNLSAEELDAMADALLAADDAKQAEAKADGTAPAQTADKPAAASAEDVSAAEKPESEKTTEEKLNDLVEKGKKAGKLSSKDLMVLEDMNLSSEETEKFYDRLESLSIDVLGDDALPPVDEDALYDQREDVAEEINEILLHRLKNNIRFCPLCGKALPLHHRGRVCDACYRRMRK